MALLITSITGRCEISRFPCIFTNNICFRELKQFVLVEVFDSPEEVLVTIDHSQFHPLCTPVVSAVATCHKELRDILGRSIDGLVKEVDMDDIVLLGSAGELDVAAFAICIVEEFSLNRILDILCERSGVAITGEYGASIPATLMSQVK